MNFRKVVGAVVAVSVLKGMSLGSAHADLPLFRPELRSPKPLNLRMRKDVAPTSGAAWADFELARIKFSSAGDKRKPSERKSGLDLLKGEEEIDRARGEVPVIVERPGTYQLNENGIISGKNFIDLNANSFESQVLEPMLKTQPENIDPTKSVEALWQIYRENLENRSMAILALARILDHEAMKRKLAVARLSEARVSYILRSVLIEFGIQSGRISTASTPLPTTSLIGNPIEKDPCGRTEDRAVTQDVSLVDDATMFAWLSDAFNEKIQSLIAAKVKSTSANLSAEEIALITDPVSLTIEVDWTNGANMGLEKELRAVQNETGVHWPEVDADQVVECRTYRKGEEQSVAMKITAKQFPQSVTEMRAQIRKQLEATYRSHYRQAVWSGLLAAHRSRSFAQEPREKLHALAYKLFKQNPLEMTRNFCVDPAWPCSKAGDPSEGPQLLADALFADAQSNLDRVFMVPND